ncbi:hypothetical protein SAMN04515618_10868 [Collimonas sp. OK307]|uniref:hypothetical protein n=1 Tax=Collimonas sp. OK307 TaxID=1801620 RepID=UPI0008E9428C|nr:hypothetical protein [Collimonas sp. OK307]SFI02715.1 hypothetical protein SAMN04515618_10868 [Collimonas sp. OK307]
MDIFALHPTSKKHFFITEATYFEQTQRRPQWATKTKSIPQMPLYLATCPECKNAIEIRELDRVRGENNRAPMAPFGKHYQHDVSGLDIVYSQEAYDRCSLRAKVSLGASEPRQNTAFNAEILIMLVEHAAVIRGTISNVIGIKVSSKLFKSMMKKFIEESRYKCKGVIPSNLPFAMAYWMESQSLVGQYVFDVKMVEAVNNSHHFCIDDEQIIPKEWKKIREDAKRAGRLPATKMSWGAHNLAFYFGRRVHRGAEHNGELNHMTLKVTEHPNNKQTGREIYSTKIEYSNSHFFKAIVAEERQLAQPEKAQETLRKKIEAGEMAFTFIAPLLPKDWKPSWRSQTNPQ